MTEPLHPLLRKAARDAGFDRDFGPDDGWYAIGIAGIPGRVWVRVSADSEGALLALPNADLVAGSRREPVEGVPLPDGAVGAVTYDSAAGLLNALRRIRSSLPEVPFTPELLIGPAVPPRDLLPIGHRPGTELPAGLRPASLMDQLTQRIAAVGATEKDTVVRRRIGQDLYREALMALWDGCCAVTGLAMPEFLRASHAKPWSEATDAERLDVHNGFLLAVHLDAAFDLGLMTFSDDGSAMFRDGLAGDVLALLTGSGEVRLRWVEEGHRPYLAFHRRKYGFE